MNDGEIWCPSGGPPSGGRDPRPADRVAPASPPPGGGGESWRHQADPPGAHRRALLPRLTESLEVSRRSGGNLSVNNKNS